MVMYVTKESTGFCLWQINEFSRQYLYPYYCNLSLLVAENVAVGNPLWSRMSLVVNKWCIFLESFRTMASQASTLSSPLTNNCRNDTKGIRICCRSSLASGVSLKGPFLCAVMKGVGGGGVSLCIIGVGLVNALPRVSLANTTRLHVPPLHSRQSPLPHTYDCLLH